MKHHIPLWKRNFSTYGKHHAASFTLIELLVVMAIGLIFLIGAAAVVLLILFLCGVFT